MKYLLLTLWVGLTACLKIVDVGPTNFIPTKDTTNVYVRLTTIDSKFSFNMRADSTLVEPLEFVLYIETLDTVYRLPLVLKDKTSNVKLVTVFPAEPIKGYCCIPIETKQKVFVFNYGGY